MKLFYLSADNLRNAPFVKDLVYNFKDVGKAIILHDHFGGVGDTRFVTKRISALMSEEMITNNAFSGDQRNILTQADGNIAVRTELLENALRTVDLILLNPLGMEGGALKQLEPLQVLAQLRAAFGLTEIHIFPKNTRSPLVAAWRRLETAADIAQWMAIYEEESRALEVAAQMLPVILAAPGNFKQATS